MEKCSFWSDSHVAASRSHCSTHGDRHPTACAMELRKELDAALLQIRTKDKALEECIGVLRTCRDYGAQEAEKSARAALLGKPKEVGCTDPEAEGSW